MSSERSDNPKVEFAKSGRSKCRGCQENILKDSPRIGIPSPFTTPKGEVITSYRYYHTECTPRFELHGIVSYLETEKLENSELQKDTLTTLNQLLKNKSTKEAKVEQPINEPFLEYAKSSRGKCKICDEKIEKDTLRVAEPTLIELDDGRRFSSNKYNHLDCYLNRANEPKTLMSTLIETSLEIKTVQEEQIEQINQKYRSFYEQDTGVAEILASIGSEPVNFSVLRSLAKEKGIKFKDIETAIDRALGLGEYFKPTPDTVQKLA